MSFLPSESLRWSEIILRCLLSTLKIQFDEDILITGQQSLMMLLERIESLFRDNEREIIEFYKISLGKIFDKDYIIMTENLGLNDQTKVCIFFKFGFKTNIFLSLERIFHGKVL